MKYYIYYNYAKVAMYYLGGFTSSRQHAIKFDSIAEAKKQIKQIKTSRVLHIEDENGQKIDFLSEKNSYGK